MICWMFPGQPLRHAPFASSNDNGEIISLCQKISGFDPSTWQENVCLPSEHVRLQLYGTATSLCRTRQLRTTGRPPDLVIEHSMGIYASLAACGSISEYESAEMTFRVGNVLARMSQKKTYAFGCVIGLACTPVETAASNHCVFVANYNTPCHHLLAGERSGIVSALEECAASGAFSVSLFECDAPLHTPLLEDAAAELSHIFSDYSYGEPTVPLIEHIGQKRLNAASIRPFLLDELLQPVRWHRSYTAACRFGSRSFIEVGAGDALKKFNRWIDSQVQT